MKKGVLFCSEILRVKPCWLALYQVNGRNIMYLMLLQHILAVFTTSLVQTAEHKMAALTGVFS